MSTDWNFYLFGTQSGPKIGPLRPIFSLHLKVLAMSMWSNTDVNQWKPLRKWIKTWILTYFGTQNGPDIGPLRPIFHTPLKVLAMSMWGNICVKPVNTFWESEFWLTLRSKMAKNGVFEAYIVHTSESSPNDHIKQDWSDSRRKL